MVSTQLLSKNSAKWLKNWAKSKVWQFSSLAISCLNFYQVSTRFGIIDHGHIIREITKDEFEHLSEDYIVLKTNQLALASRILQDQLHQHFKVVNSDNEIHIFDKSHVIKAIVKELVKQEVDIDEIYYKRQDLENYFTQLVDSERR